MSSNVEISSKLASFIATRDARLSKRAPHNDSQLADAFGSLISRGHVKFGGRESCGCTDQTLIALRAWNEVIRKAKSLGYSITETNLPQTNAWATRGGGFWRESEYRLLNA